MAKQSGGHFEVLDGLRGIAALSVALVHCAGAFGFHMSGAHIQLAVDFFFVLSGFIIGKAYEPKLFAGMTFRTFTTIRLVRLYPMVLLAVSLGVLARMVQGEFSTVAILGAAIFALLMLPLPRIGGDTAGSAFPLNGPLWSISFELLSNLAYALVAPALTTRRLAVFTALMVGGLAAYCFTQGGVAQNGGWNIGLLWGVVRVFASFSIGLLVYRAYDHLGSRLRTVPGAWSGVMLAALLLVIVWLPVGQSGLYDFVAITVALPLIVAAGLVCRNATWLSSTWSWLGAISYPIYAINQPIAEMARDLARPFDPSVQQQAGLAAFSMAAAVTGAHFAVRLYDEPLRQWLRLRLGGARSTSSAAAT